jgi:hypothetical protein
MLGFGSRDDVSSSSNYADRAESIENQAMETLKGSDPGADCGANHVDTVGIADSL